MDKQKQQRLSHMDGARGLFCFMILVGHFWSIYMLRSDPQVFQIPLLETLRSSFALRYPLTGILWLGGFFMVSGYLAALSRVESLFSLVQKCVLRYLRLFLPVLGACAGIYVIQQTLGFHNAGTAAFLQSPVFQNAYWKSLTFGDIWTESVRLFREGFCFFNDPYWVLRDIFLASLLSYGCNYADNLLHRRTGRRLPLVTVAVMYLTWKRGRQYILICLAGYLVGHCREDIRKLSKAKLALVLVCLAGVMMWYVRRYLAWGTAEQALESNEFTLLLWCALLVVLERWNGLQKALSVKPLLVLGKLSFGVYSFHWPVMCSFGALAMLKGFSSGWSNGMLLLAAFAVTVAVTLGISAVYHITVEKASAWFTGSVARLTGKGYSFVMQKLRRCDK